MNHHVVLAYFLGFLFLLLLPARRSLHVTGKRISTTRETSCQVATNLKGCLHERERGVWFMSETGEEHQHKKEYLYGRALRAMLCGQICAIHCSITSMWSYHTDESACMDGTKPTICFQEVS